MRWIDGANGNIKGIDNIINYDNAAQRQEKENKDERKSNIGSNGAEDVWQGCQGA